MKVVTSQLIAAIYLSEATLVINHVLEQLFVTISDIFYRALLIEK